MRNKLRLLIAALALASANAASAAETGRKVFVSCPILRNTTLPCWLGQDSGQLYYLGPQGDLTADFYPPQFHHRMLVEAELAEGPKICGGIPLKNVTASVLPDFDESCNVMLPAEGYADPPAKRGSGPSGVRGAAPAEGYQPGPPAPPPAPQPPFATKTFTATFDADSDRKWRQALAAIAEAAHYAQAMNAERIEVVGYSAAIRLTNGQNYVEQPAIAEDRARATEEALRTLGLPKATRLTVTWRSRPAPSTGTPEDASARKAVITVIPARQAR